MQTCTFHVDAAIVRFFADLGRYVVASRVLLSTSLHVPVSTHGVHDQGFLHPNVDTHP